MLVNIYASSGEKGKLTLLGRVENTNIKTIPNAKYKDQILSAGIQGPPHTEVPLPFQSDFFPDSPDKPTNVFLSIETS